MLKAVRVLLGLTLVAAVVVIAGCTLFDDEQTSLPTGPTLSGARENANFYGGGGNPNGFGVYFQQGVLVINVPQAGDYVVPYCVTSPSFTNPEQKWCYTVIFRATKATMIYIGLYGDHVLTDAAVIPTTITADESIAKPMGEVLAFSYPGIYENDATNEIWNDVMEMTTLTPTSTSISTHLGEVNTDEEWSPYTALNGCLEGSNLSENYGTWSISSTCSTPTEQGIPMTPLVQDGTVQSSPGANGEPAVVEMPKDEALPSCPNNASGVPMC
ncbi:hypothetical protein U14_04024 [Candidatus Moduliflexus flocculans]|uniref:Uncharacterized protein n=1 Tax=Candidatus Moduliflexus flocculans TaxID=1499966 RepID=A0A0S6W359_9BACT|nr:hypothetical protein U14_04024 [Candidatus Moduliflexus flocculans]